MTSVEDGGFYGWPYSYWGQHVDPRVKPENPERVEATISPDYSLGSHRAPLGVDFSNDAVGGEFTNGVFIGEHGSWNRSDLAGYKVVFVPFENGQPAGDPVDFVSGFLTDDGKTRGRPVGVTVAPDGSVIVADDMTNAVWRVTRDDAGSSQTMSDDQSPTSTGDAASPEGEPTMSGDESATAEDGAATSDDNAATSGDEPAATEGETNTSS